MMSDEITTREELRALIVSQCNVIMHLAHAITETFGAKAEIVARGLYDDHLEYAGRDALQVMERLGDILNERDAVDESDEWTDPIFEKAHAAFPTKRAAS